MFKDIDQTHLVKFGLYPFSKEFAEKLKDKKVNVESKNLPFYELCLEKDQRLIFVKRGKIDRFTIFICLKCGEIYRADSKDRYHIATIKQNNKDVTYVSPFCTKCGHYDDMVCESCNRSMSMNDKKEWYCAGCQKKFPRFTLRKETEVKSYTYLLGWQKTVDGKNHKSILFIDEDGNCVVSDDFNKVKR